VSECEGERGGKGNEDVRGWRADEELGSAFALVFCANDWDFWDGGERSYG
jgi:hypothetical protein